MFNLEIDETLKTPVTALDPAHNGTKATMYCIVVLSFLFAQKNVGKTWMVTNNGAELLMGREE